MSGLALARDVLSGGDTAAAKYLLLGRSGQLETHHRPERDDENEKSERERGTESDDVPPHYENAEKTENGGYSPEDEIDLPHRTVTVEEHVMEMPMIGLEHGTVRDEPPHECERRVEKRHGEYHDVARDPVEDVLAGRDEEQRDETEQKPEKEAA